MDICLFDLYATGHHLPYAARTSRAIEAVSNHDVTFVTLSETDQSSRLFDRTDIVYLDDSESSLIEERHGDFDEVADRTVEEFFADGMAGRFDVVQFLYSDDILGPLWRHAFSTDGPQLVGELSGVFFKCGTLSRRRFVHPVFLTLLASPVAGLIDAVVPTRSDHEQFWRDLYLYRGLKHESFDHLITHSDEAEEYVARLDTWRGTPTTNVPYPAPDSFGRDITRERAREKLDLPLDDPILLYFGSLRQEKGIDRLLRVLRRYRGPSFTMVIAGPPATVTEEAVLAAAEASRLPVITELEYIEAQELYYRATDAILLPYEREFGRECTSQSLEEACSAMLPVIVPNFGAVGRITREDELGLTYEQGSDEALMEALSQFARDEITYSEDSMGDHTRRHSHERAAQELVEIYEGLLE